jgi:hypothetical protein
MHTRRRHLTRKRLIASRRISPERLRRAHIYQEAVVVPQLLAAGTLAAGGRLRELGVAATKEAATAGPMADGNWPATVDTLFRTDDDHLWGWFDESEDRVVAHGSAADGDIDFLDFAALMTLRQLGSVTLVAREALPPPGLSAAILRY